MRKKARLQWMLLAAIGVAVILLWRIVFPSTDALKVQGDQMIALIERYRELHGEYPPSLVDAGITPPIHGYEPWQYQRGGDYFILAVGDYARDDFVLYYISGKHGWYLDD